MSSMNNERKMQSLIYLAFSIIDADDNLKKTLPEIVYSLDENSLIRFLKFFGGRTITVPTMDEVAKALLTAVITYKVIKENLSLDNMFEKYQFPDNYKSYIIDTFNKYSNSLSVDEKNFIKNM